MWRAGVLECGEGLVDLESAGKVLGGLHVEAGVVEAANEGQRVSLADTCQIGQVMGEQRT